MPSAAPGEGHGGCGRHLQSRLLCWPYHSKPHVGSRGALQPHTASPVASQGWVGVNSRGGLSCHRAVGDGPGCREQKPCESHCCAFCRVRVGMEAREDLRMSMGRGGAAPNSGELGSLTPHLPSPAPPRGRHSPNTGSVLVHLPPGGPSTRPMRPSPLPGEPRVLLLSWCRSAASLVGAGLCPRRWQETLTRTSVPAGGKQAGLRPRHRGLGVTDCPLGPGEALQAGRPVGSLPLLSIDIGVNCMKLMGS